MTRQKIWAALGALILTLGTAGVVLADAANPSSIDSDVNGFTVTLSGDWDWASHDKDNGKCDDRWVGWAVDWDDPNAAGHQVGDTEWFVGTPDDNAVHTNENCGSSAGGFPVGEWGPISHTYTEPGEYHVCVLMYDIHLKDGEPKDAKELVAGGSTNQDHNKDNSAQENDLEQEGNVACAATTIIIEEPEPTPSFEQSQEGVTDAPTQASTDSVDGTGTAAPGQGAWILVIALGALLASVVVLTPVRKKSRR